MSGFLPARALDEQGAVMSAVVHSHDGVAAAAEGEAHGLRPQVRILAASAVVGLLVGGVVGGIGGRLAMRLLVLTSDDAFDGSITDDDATVNELTFSGTVGLVFFIAVATVGIAWLYVGARSCLPPSRRIRATVWGVLAWSVIGPGVFEPEGFDFTALSPRWLGVLVFTAIFFGVGALVALGVERALERYPSSIPALALPFVPLIPVAPFLVGAPLALVGAEASKRWAAVRMIGIAVMAAIVLLLGVPTFFDVVEILR